MMEHATFQKAVEGIKELGIHRVRVAGGGEPTLHPAFVDFVKELKLSTDYVSVLSNGQWREPRQVIRGLLAAPVDLIEISVEGTTREVYENSSKRGSFTRLLANLSQLKRERDQAKSRSHINLRVMVRPSDRGKKSTLRDFWKPFCDSLLFQRLIRIRGLEGVADLYAPSQADEQRYPKCSIPFKAMEINWDGNIPLCCYSVAQCGPPGFILGNITNDNLGEIWKGSILSAYRRAHRERNHSQMEICQGCTGI